MRKRKRYYLFCFSFDNASFYCRTLEFVFAESSAHKISFLFHHHVLIYFDLLMLKVYGMVLRWWGYKTPPCKLRGKTKSLMCVTFERPRSKKVVRSRGIYEVGARATKPVPHKHNYVNSSVYIV